MIEDLENEEWRDVNGYEGLYQISNYSRIKSFKLNKVILMKTHFNKGYIQIRLLKNKERKTYRVHRILAIAFIPNPNNLLEINHIDGVKNNNRLSNLEWCDRHHNTKHASNTGLNPPNNGAKNGMSKLT